MKHENIKLKLKSIGLATFLTFAFPLSTVLAQTSINTSGGNASGNGGSVSYSIGQVMYNTNTGTSGSITEGVHQPYEISVVIGIEEAKGINLLLSAYPNPTTDCLMLEVEDNVKMQYFASLYDFNGKLLQVKSITDKQTSIDMSNLATATYFLKVTVNTQDLTSKEVKTFKIIKN